MSRRKWDFDSVTAEARKYTRVIDFKYGSRGAYDWAERNGVVGDVTAFMSEVTDPGQLMVKIEGELGSAARYAKVAHDIWGADPSPFFEASSDPEQISAGTYMDFEAQMHDQASIERSDRALDHIEQLKKHGTPEQIHQAWVMYLQYQTGTWEVDTGIAGIYMQEEEQGGSSDA
jgi:hypothetical protein